MYQENLFQSSSKKPAFSFICRNIFEKSFITAMGDFLLCSHRIVYTLGEWGGFSTVMQTRDCVTVSNSPKCPLQLQIMLISYHLTLSTLAFASRFLCGSGTSDCLGPSLTKPKILGGSGGGGGHAPLGNFEQLCCFRLHFQGRYINFLEYDIIFQGPPTMYIMIFLKPPFFQAQK